MTAILFSAEIPATSTSTTTYTSFTIAPTYDSSSFWSAGTPTQITIPQDGHYLFLAGFLAGGATATRHGRLLKNGTDVLTDNNVPSPGIALGAIGQNLTTIACLEAGDTIEFQFHWGSSVTQFLHGFMVCLRVPQPYFLGDVTGQSSGIQDLDKVIDLGGFWSSGNPSRVTAPTTGNYLYVMKCYSVGDLVFEVLLNGSLFHRGTRESGAQVGNATVAGIATLTAGDYLEMTQDTSSTTGQNQFLVVYLDSSPCATASQATGTGGITSGPTTVLFDTEIVDTAGFHSTSSNTGRLTMPSSGVYLTVANLKLQGFTTSNEQMYKNGSALTEYFQNVRATTAAPNWASMIVAYGNSLSSGDYMEMKAGTDSGSAKTTQIDGTRFTVVGMDGWTYADDVDCFGNARFLPQIYRRRGGAR